MQATDKNRREGGRGPGLQLSESGSENLNISTPRKCQRVGLIHSILRQESGLVALQILEEEQESCKLRKGNNRI